jgi:hypothetical protein
MRCKPGYVSPLRNVTQHSSEPQRKPGIVVVQQVFGQHPSQVVFIDDRTRSNSSRRRVPIIRSQIALDYTVNCTRSR